MKMLKIFSTVVLILDLKLSQIVSANFPQGVMKTT